MVRQPHRFGLAYPERMLQTIASSPQDVAHIAAATAMAGTASISPLHDDNKANAAVTVSDAASDSGCSTTDEELCDITDKMSDRASPQDYNSPYEQQPIGSEDIFCMDSMENCSELDLDMIENNWRQADLAQAVYLYY